MRKKSTKTARKKQIISPPPFPLESVDHEADRLKELLRDPKLDNNASDILSRCIVDLSDRLRIDVTQPDIAWVLWCEANDKYDPERLPDPHIKQAFSEIREVLQGATKNRLKEIIEARYEREDQVLEGRITDRTRVLEAAYELLHNPKTPVGLWNGIATFFTEQSNLCGDAFFHSLPYLKEVLSTVSADETIGKSLKERRARHAKK